MKNFEAQYSLILLYL